MSETADQHAGAPPPPGHNKVEIAIGGHSVLIESAEPLVDVISYALGVYEQTRDAAERIPLGFDITGGQFELAEPYVEPRDAEGREEEHVRRLGGKQSQDGTTRRLAIPDPAGHHRARLGSVQVDSGRAPVPRAGH